jgi:hypothetical protein
MLACSVAALFAALVLSATLLAQQSSGWLVIGAGVAVFPALPLLWHGLADSGGRAGGSTLTPRTRFAVRCLAVALLVFGVSLADLGPKRIGQNLRALASHVHGKSTSKPESVAFPAQAAAKHHGLESFIPADATLAVGLAGSTAMEQLLAAHGIDTREKLSALATCQIDFASARVLVAARGGQHMIVLRAPGLGDERNLYCLVGLMGPQRLQVRPDDSGAGKVLQVNGFLSVPLLFRLLDATTIIATDASWRDTVDQKLFSADLTAATGRLALPLLRVDRTTPLWVVSVDETEQGVWDLAIDSRQDGTLFKLQGSSTPPSGPADRAEISLRVPLAFARALPESTVILGIRGMMAALVATGGTPSPLKVLPLPPSAEAARDAGAR